MKTSWTELPVALDRTSAAPLHVQLEHELRAAIRHGRLAPGAPLPSTRALARDLGISRGVVVEAYSQLVAEGYLTSRAGSATRVAAGIRDTTGELEAAPQPPPPRYDFHPGLPDVGAFPRAAWERSLRAAIREAPADALGYGDMRGVPALRHALATYVRRVRGAHAEPDRIQVCSGITQGVALLARALQARGIERIGLEDPGFFLHRLAVAHHGSEPVPIPVDDEGIDVAALDESGVRAVLVTPAHQSPTGAVLSPARRAALLEWAEERNAFVIEDDYDAEHRYDRAPVGCLQGLAPERVVYAGSASKSLSPALRLGWLALPARLAGRVLAAKALHDSGSPALEQLALADFIERGELDRHLRRVRPVYRRRRDALLAALRRHLPQARLPRAPAAGLHLVVELPGEVDEQRLLEALGRRRVLAQGMSLSWFHPAGRPPGLMLGYAAMPEPALEAGVAQIARAVEEVAG